MRGSLREKRPGVWELRVPLPRDVLSGRRRQRSATFHGTKRQAEKELARLVAEVDSGVGAAGTRTVTELLDRWWEHKRGRLSPTTAHGYEQLMAKRIKPTLGSLRLDRLTAAELDDYYHRLSEEGLAPSSVRQVHAVLSGALGQAVRWRWIATNPARDATLPKARRSKINPPSPDKVRDLLCLAEEHSAEMGMFVRLAALLGCRRGELCGLRWSDIDVAAGLVHVQRGVVEVGRDLIVKDTKTHADRKIAIDATTVDLLECHRTAMTDRARACGVELDPDAYVLSEAPAGDVPMRPERATRAFTTLREQAGVPTARLHDLRHFVATELIGAGHDVRTVAGRLGHANPSTTLSTYAAFQQARDRDAADNLGRLLE